MSDESYQNTLHFLHAHIDILDHTPIKHSCRHMPPTAFLLERIETLQDNAFTGGETVSYIREIVMKVTGRHVPCSLYLHAEEAETTLVR
jgi:hypothetical protein